MARRALLCGVNVYESQPGLRGCVHDVENLHSLLTRVYGFKTQDIHSLTDAEVVKDKLRREWKWLLSGAKAGDTLIFHFSGHGSYLPYGDDDEEDGRDEILCLHDMDFGVETTYLRDDELGAWTREVSNGVDLVVVTDCCHAGSNTRMVLAEVNGRMLSISLEHANAIKSVKAAGAMEVQPNEVIPRFLQPPRHFAKRESLARKKRERKASDLNHLHLGACRDDETAADASLDGAYNGAFTYYLCQALEADPSVNSTELIAQLAPTLTVFSQRPVENGGPRRGPIFGGNSSPTNRTDPVTGSIVREETARQLLAAIRELTTHIALRRDEPKRSPAKRVLVYVHGISEHPGDYSLPWWNALRAHCDGRFGAGELNDTRIGVHWSDIVNSRSIGADNEEVLVRQMIEREILEDAARYAKPDRTTDQRFTRVAYASRGLPQIDDFVKYMLNAAVRSEVISRFTEKVRPILANGSQIDIISHSWGTVVAYEGLLKLQSEGLPGIVLNLFSVGSALSLGTVRWTLDLKPLRPVQVQKWINLDAEGDAVGGSIKDHFPVDREYLELEPTGCERGWLGYGIACAHRSYFLEENLKVNRDVFAAHILDI